MTAKLKRIARKINNAREWVWEYASTRELPRELDSAVEEIDEALEILEELVDEDELS